MALPSRVQLLLLFIMAMSSSPSSQMHDPAVIDTIVRDSAVRSYPKRHHKTATIYNVALPATLSSVAADVVRFRAGSLRRYGTVIKEFHIAPGLVVHPHTKRLIVVRQNLGDLSTIYNSYLNNSRFQLISPVLGLVIYDAAILLNSSKQYSSELRIIVTKKPITVDFSGIARLQRRDKPACALFRSDGTVAISNQTSLSICRVTRQGHFALVIESSTNSKNMEASGWKVAVVEVVAGVLGAVLLGLMVVAIVNVRKKRWQMAEMERRAHEEEALQLSMVGHVRAPMASVTRTSPTLENEYGHSL